MTEKDLLNEVWKPVVGYEGLYDVSNFGRVRSLNYNGTGRVQVLKQTITPNGYKRVVLYKNGKHKPFSVHRLVYEAFVGKIPEGMQIDHINTSKCDNRLENLRCVTPKENANNPITYQKNAEKNRRMAKDPEYRKKLSKIQKKRFENPEIKEERKQLMKKLWSDPEFREKKKEATQKLWSNQEFRDKFMERLEKQNNDPEFREKHRETMKKLWSDEEYVKKHAEAMQKMRNETNWQKHVSETNKRIFGKPVYQLDKETGELIRRWDCARDAARELGIKNQSISKCCKGKEKSAGGYRWCFVMPPAVIYVPEFMKNIG